MTTVTYPRPHTFTYAAIKESIMSDPSVTKVALICATFVITAVVGGLTWIAAQAGDVGALSVSIGGVLTALISAGVGVLRRRNGGSGDA